MSDDSLERAAREWYAAKYKVSIYDQDDWYAAHAADFARDRLDAQRKKVVALIKPQLELVASRVQASQERRLAAGKDGMPTAMNVQDGEDNGWKRALDWVLTALADAIEGGRDEHA
jgi:hypothetical protein